MSRFLGGAQSNCRPLSPYLVPDMFAVNYRVSQTVSTEFRSTVTLKSGKRSDKRSGLALNIKIHPDQVGSSNLCCAGWSRKMGEYVFPTVARSHQQRSFYSDVQDSAGPTGLAMVAVSLGKQK